jgi:glycerol-3-phosphate dehydrogenase
VQHLDDLMLRRTRLGLLLPAGGSQVLDAVRGICLDELGWDEARWGQELERYQKICDRYYSLPEAGAEHG